LRMAQPVVAVNYELRRKNQEGGGGN
jgi:hypothetical protein